MYVYLQAGKFFIFFQHGKTHPLSPDPSHPVAGGEAASAVSSQFSAVRANLERVRLLCELVKKREKMKQEYVCLWC